MATNYEWIVEELDVLPGAEIGEDDDIIDVHHFDTFVEARAWASDNIYPCRIGLTRDVGNDDEGLTDRSWAYVENRKLPEFFTYCPELGAKVPKRFHEEIANAY